MGVLTDLPDQCAAIRIRHRIVGFDPFLGIDTNLKPSRRFRWIGLGGRGIEGLAVHRSDSVLMHERLDHFERSE